MKNQMEMLQACINSFDDKTYEIFIFKPDEEININAQITTRKWDDGAPVTKYFDRDNKRTGYTFEEGSETLMTFSGAHSRAYWYKEGVWYSAFMDFDCDEYLESI